MFTMREHAIPQDVTGYRFHIVGNMTLKQFAEVAVGVVVAIVLYKTNLIPIVKWPLMFLSFGVGAALAWLPFEERPLDHWFSTFFSILYRPTQFFWRKQAKIPDPFLYKPDPTNEILPDEVDLSPARRQRIQDYLTSVKQTQAVDPWEIEQRQRSQLLLASFDSVQVDAVTVSQTVQKPKLQVRVRELQAFTEELAVPVIPTPIPVPSEALPVSEPIAEIAPEPISEATPPAPVTEIPPTLPSQPEPEIVSTTTTTSPLDDPEFNAPIIHVTQTVKTTSAESQDVANQILVPTAEHVDIETVSDPVLEKEETEPEKTTNVTAPAELQATPQLVSSTPNTVFMMNENSTLTQQSTGATQHNVDLPFPVRPATPNKVVGMVFTPEGKILPGAIVEIRNLKGEVARAVKTNPLGQFFITTPLDSGEYVVVTDKEGYKFPQQTLTLAGSIIDPLQIISQA